MLDDARAFALRAHAGQMYGARPYSWHLETVAELLAPYGAQAQVIAYLHDIVEDTTVSDDEVDARFGPFVGECVRLLTDAPGATRAERKAQAHARLAAVRWSRQPTAWPTSGAALPTASRVSGRSTAASIVPSGPRRTAPASANPCGANSTGCWRRMTFRRRPTADSRAWRHTQPPAPCATATPSGPGAEPMKRFAKLRAR